MGSAAEPSLLDQDLSAGGTSGSLLRYDIEPEDVLDEETLAEDARRHAQAEADDRSGERDWENALSVDDLRELAGRVRRGERVATLRKT